VLSLFMAGWSGQQDRHSRIADELNKRLKLDRWFIGFEIIRLDRDPSFTKLASWVNREMSNLPTAPETESMTCTATYNQGVGKIFPGGVGSGDTPVMSR
jgi:hypothetical protein